MREYVTVNENESQYKAQSFEYGTITDAVYVQAKSPADRGNEYIEALPVIPNQRTVMKLNSKSLIGYIESNDKSDVQKLREIQQLEDIRFPMPYDYDLWTNLYLTMVQSYSKRSTLKGRSINTITIKDENYQTDSYLVPNSLSAPLGFNMIGPSGCGKSSALEIALNYYPKVIRHIDDNGNMKIQIPYIYVTCPPDSNFKVLFGKIGREIDRYLGNTIPTIENEILGKKSSKVGEILLRLEKVIERYAIAVLMFDEVQQISFNSTKENSFNSLMTLANDTMVGIGLVGTEEVISKIVQKQQFARRVGNRIVCDTYTRNENYFNGLFRMLSRYQWGKEKVVFSNEIIHEIFMESHGIIAYLILIYTMIWSSYITNNENQKIDTEYVKKLTNRYFTLIRNALNEHTYTESERDYYAKLALENTKEQLFDDLDSIKQNKIMNETISDLGSNEIEKEFVKQQVITYVSTGFSDRYTVKSIEKAFDEVYKPSKTNQEVIQMTLKKLDKQNGQRRRMPVSKNQKIDDSVFLSIKESVGDANNPI